MIKWPIVYDRSRGILLPAGLSQTQGEDMLKIQTTKLGTPEAVHPSQFQNRAARKPQALLVRACW